MTEPLHPYQHAEMAASTDLALVEENEPEVEFDLLDPRTITECIACGNSDAIRREYHEVAYLNGVCGDKYGWPNVRHIPPHICARCWKCKYGWVERLRHERD